MEVQENNLTKLCSFYISDWHLVTMLLPYISKKVNERVEIATILEKNIKDNVETLVEKLNLKNDEGILSIDWNSKSKKDNYNLEKIIKNSKKEKVIIVNGNKEFIEDVNIHIEKYIKNIDELNIKIVNCYEITQYDGSINEILDSHDKVLNTSGEKEIYEVFEDYKKKKIS